FIQNHFDHVLINKRIQKKNYKVKENDLIEFVYPEPPTVHLVPEDLDLDIVYEDDYLIVVNKPAGLVVHPSKGHYTGTLVHGLLNKLNNFMDKVAEVDSEAIENGEISEGLSGCDQPEERNYLYRPGIVHRLDKETSGLLVVAKSLGIQRKLMVLFQKRQVEKEYIALVKGKIPLEGKFDDPIGRHPVHRKKYTIDRLGPNAKSALTYYKRIQYFEVYKGHQQKYSLVKIRLITGRTHQIRVHFAGNGHSVVGDLIYSKTNSPFEKRGMALCAKQLAFVHPATGEAMCFQIELPDYFKDMLSDLETGLHAESLE
ncbi:MAG TPA: RluA family pseudouridine synthase, partial [Spirochaetes bacterium]|nr:RluA family pseudouridine synthase [Spirochaetota bacterium]